MTELTNTRARREHGRLRKQAVVRRVPRSALITGRATAVRQQGHARRFGVMTVINPAETNALKCPVPQDNTPVETTVQSEKTAQPLTHEELMAALRKQVHAPLHCRDGCRLSITSPRRIFPRTAI